MSALEAPALEPLALEGRLVSALGPPALEPPKRLPVGSASEGRLSALEERPWMGSAFEPPALGAYTLPRSPGVPWDSFAGRQCTRVW